MKTAEFPREVDWDSYLFRCSSLGELMPGPRAKEGELQQTQIAALDKIWLEEVYGVVTEVNSKYFDKGIIAQEDGIALLQATKYPDTYIHENKERFSNAFITGRPDVIIPGEIVHDIKLSYDPMTFKKASYMWKSGSKLHTYEWQVIGYMWLLEIPTAEVNHCLVDTPIGLVYDEVKRHTFYRGIDESDERYQLVEAQIEHNHTPSEYIALKRRIKTQRIERNEEYERALMANVPIWREYLKNNTL